jgi:hypothetical protein
MSRSKRKLTCSCAQLLKRGLIRLQKVACELVLANLVVSPCALHLFAYFPQHLIQVTQLIKFLKFVISSRCT